MFRTADGLRWIALQNTLTTSEAEQAPHRGQAPGLTAAAQSISRQRGQKGSHGEGIDFFRPHVLTILGEKVAGQKGEEAL